MFPDRLSTKCTVQVSPAAPISIRSVLLLIRDDQIEY